MQKNGTDLQSLVAQNKSSKQFIQHCVSIIYVVLDQEWRWNLELIRKPLISE